MASIEKITHKAYLVHEELQNMDLNEFEMNLFVQELIKIINEKKVINMETHWVIIIAIVCFGIGFFCGKLSEL